MRAVAGFLALITVGGACARGGSEADRARGAELYAAVCARCHGPDGAGGLPVASGQSPRNFRDAAFQQSVTDGDLRRVIVQGKPPGMPAFGTAFKAAEIDAIVAHVRSFQPSR